MVDALALGASGATHGGSSPLLGTRQDRFNIVNMYGDLEKQLSSTNLYVSYGAIIANLFFAFYAFGKNVNKSIYLLIGIALIVLAMSSIFAPIYLSL